MAQRKYSLGLVGDGYCVSENGIVKIIDDQVYICDLNVRDMAKEFEGRWIEIAMADPQPPADVPIDEKIKPLVDALRSRGVNTLSSCEGHLLIENRVHYPFVSFYHKGLVAPDKIPVAPTWRISNIGLNVWRLRTIGDATTEEELANLQNQIKDELAVL